LCLVHALFPIRVMSFEIDEFVAHRENALGYRLGQSSLYWNSVAEQMGENCAPDSIGIALSYFALIFAFCFASDS
jgi:hypothetical protein